MNSIEKTWRKLLKDVLYYGTEHTKDDGDVLLEHLINHEFIDNVVFESRNQQLITNDVFLKLIGNGAYNIDGYVMKDESLQAYVKQVDSAEQIYLTDDKDSFIYTYPERIFNIKSSNREKESDEYNQFETMTNRLKNYCGSNRAVATVYSVGLDGDIDDIPCLNWLQATIRDDELVLHCMFRSNDLFNAFPANMMFLNYVGLKLVENLKTIMPTLTFKGINYNSTSLHIYKADIEKAKEIIRGDDLR